MGSSLDYTQPKTNKQTNKNRKLEEIFLEIYKADMQREKE